MTAAPRRQTGYARRAQGITARLGYDNATESPWEPDALVDPSAPHYGTYSDPVWAFGQQAPNQSDHACDVDWSVGPDRTWPTQEWTAVGRDFGMALLGRRAGRTALARGRNKPRTVFNRLLLLAVIARWAELTGRGLPSQWDETVGPALLADLRANRVPRLHARRATSDASAARYLGVLGLLWDHRDLVAEGPMAQPWPDFMTTSPDALVNGPVRTTLTPAVATEVIDPAVWWALIRFAIRFLDVYGPDLLPAWKEYLRRGRTGRTGTRTGVHVGPPSLDLLLAFEAKPDARILINADGSPNIWQTVPLIGVAPTAFTDRNPLANECRAVIDRMMTQGRTSRFWFGEVRTTHRSDGTTGPWTAALDTPTLLQLVGRLRDACYILIAALGALRDSETQGLRRGTLTIADGGYALAGHIIKGNEQAQEATWWIDPIVARCVHTLEALGENVDVTDLREGVRIPSDRLFWRLNSGAWGKAGLGAGHGVLGACIEWINENADIYDLPRAAGPGAPAIPMQVTPHQLRTTFAAVAAMEPDGPLGVVEQLHDTFTVAAAYMANSDRKWFDVHRAHREQVTAARLRGYLRGGRDLLCGPGSSGLAADLDLAAADAQVLTAPEEAPESLTGLVDDLLVAAGRTFGASTLSHCRGRVADARCAAVFIALNPDEPFQPNFEADVCFGATPADDCRNVIYDPPDHLPVWDVALAAYEAEVDALPPERSAAGAELTRQIEAARSRIQAMEAACLARPHGALTRFLTELERYLDFMRFDIDIPGAADQYRHLYAATRDRITWLRERAPQRDIPDWALPRSSQEAQ
jgi:hypothetical protein